MNKEYLKALEGHVHKKEILDILAYPLEPSEAYDYVEGYVVDVPFSLDNQCPMGGMATVHRQPHWKGGFDPVGFIRYDERQKKKRSVFGLEFLIKPNGNGRYEKVGPSNKRKVCAAYTLQHHKEWLV
jgi:hypothetical protein